MARIIYLYIFYSSIMDLFVLASECMENPGLSAFLGTWKPDGSCEYRPVLLARSSVVRFHVWQNPTENVTCLQGIHGRGRGPLPPSEFSGVAPQLGRGGSLFLGRGGGGGGGVLALLE